MDWLFSTITALVRWWRHDHVPAKQAVVYCALLSAVFFLLGSHYPQADYRKLQDTLADTLAESRLFAKEVARHNSQLKNMHSRDNLNKKTIELLNDRIDLLEKQSLYWQEQTTFYRHVLENKPLGGEILIHALDVHPDFTRQGWEVSAILARPGKRKDFKGGYYLEVVRENEDGTHTLLRLPAEGTQELSMAFYHEIRESVNLPADSNIINVRLVILDGKGGQVATDALIDDNNGDAEAVDETQELLGES